MLISTLSHALGAMIEVMQCLFFVSQLLRSHFGTVELGVNLQLRGKVSLRSLLQCIPKSLKGQRSVPILLLPSNSDHAQHKAFLISLELATTRMAQIDLG